MAVKMDEQVARAFGHLRTPQFKPLLDFLIATRADSLEKLAQAHEQAAIYRLQGEIKNLKDLIGYIEQSDVLVNNLKR